jgi:hypothetical protein
MKLYKITIEIDISNEDSHEYKVYRGQNTSNWSGYNEQTAIAQAFLYHAQNGARELKVIEIIEIK